MADALQAFMATMVASAPPVPIARAVALAHEHYGLEVQAAHMSGERDQNFKLSAADGAEYVLKIAHAAEEPAVTELPTAALQHLEQADPALPCPRVVRTRAGGTQAHFCDASGRERSARLLSYLPGTLLGSTQRSAQQRRSCGRMAGRLTRALRDFEHTAAHRAVIWDVRHVGQLRRLLADLPDFPHHHAAAELLSYLIPRIETGLPRLRHQVVHNDINPLNVLVDPRDPARVIGIIDFGDLTHTAVIADVAVAAAEQIPPDCGNDSARARAAVLDIAEAYHENVPLRAEELLMLGTLAAARLAANLVVHEWYLFQNPATDHYTALEPAFIGARLTIARELAREEFEL